MMDADAPRASGCLIQSEDAAAGTRMRLSLCEGGWLSNAFHAERCIT